MTIGQNTFYPNRFVEIGADAANSVYLDFHSSDSALPDYSTRIQSNGGATTGQGQLLMYASTIGIFGSSGVGIGTSNPQNTFSIYNTTADSTKAPDGDYRSGQLVITNSKTGTSVYGMAIGMDQVYGIGYINAAGNSAAQPVCLNTRGGSVGIGITNPTGKCHIYGAGQSTGTGDVYSFNISSADSFNGNGAITVYSESINMKAGDLTWGGGVRVYGARIYIGGGYSINGAQNQGYIGMYTGNAERVRFTDAGISIAGANVINFGYDQTKEGNAGKIGYQPFSSALDIVGAGTGTRTVKIWDNLMISANVGIGTFSPDVALHIYNSVSRSYTNGSSLAVQFAMIESNGGRWYIGQNQSINSNLYFIANVNTNSFTTLDVCGYVENDTASAARMNFTGQHRCAYDSSIGESTSEGLIVRATGTYWSLTDLYDNTSPIDHITINESLPQITLVREANCSSVFGAVSFTEDTNKTRKHSAGRFTSVYANPFGEKKRVFVNALGEGGVWVCNINGNFTIGDLITTSTVPGYGMLQSSNQILNYTFGKITMDCDFQPALCPVQTVRTKQESKTTIEELFEDQITEEFTTEIVFDEETQRYVQKKITKQTTKQVPLSDSFPLYDESGAVIGNHTVPRKGPKTIVSTVEDLDANGNVQWDPSLDENGVPITKPAYRLRYLDADGTILTKDQYDARIQNGQPAYLAAFVGCIYLCG